MTRALNERGTGRLKGSKYHDQGMFAVFAGEQLNVSTAEECRSGGFSAIKVPGGPCEGNWVPNVCGVRFRRPHCVCVCVCTARSELSDLQSL